MEWSTPDRVTKEFEFEGGWISSRFCMAGSESVLIDLIFIGELSSKIYSG